MSDPNVLLTLWEQVLGLSPRQRDDLLLQAAHPHRPPPLALGARNHGLLDLHVALFGPRLALRSTCPGCSCELEFEFEIAALQAGAAPVETGDELRHEAWVLSFRLPNADDLDDAARASDEEAAVQRLLDRCVLSAECHGETRRTQALPRTLRRLLSERMEALDPAASPAFDMHCPACEQDWQAPLDIGVLLWQRCQDSAERLLLAVDHLASRYGWSEAQILALSPTRRAAYLQLGAG